MPRTGRPKKSYLNSADKLQAAQAADRQAILVARKKVKQTDEWINADEIERKAILERVKRNVLHQRENSGHSGK
jgi:hypothetical protein